MSLDNEEPITYGCDTESESEPECSSEENTYIPSSLELVPDFTPIISAFSTHHAAHRRPNTINKESPSAFFKLFVTDTDFQLFATNGEHIPGLKIHLPVETLIKENKDYYGNLNRHDHGMKQLIKSCWCGLDC